MSDAGDLLDINIVSDMVRHPQGVAHRIAAVGTSIIGPNDLLIAAA